MVLLCLYMVAIVVLFPTQFESGQSESPFKSYDRLNIHRFNSKKKGIYFLGRAVVNASFIPPFWSHSWKSINRLFTPPLSDIRILSTLSEDNAVGISPIELFWLQSTTSIVLGLVFHSSLYDIY